MLSISSYFSVGYLGLYLPVTVLLYTILPKRARRVLLLLFSFLCFWAVSGKLIAYLLLSILSIHHIGLWLTDLHRRCDDELADAPKEERKRIRGLFQRRQRYVIAFAVVLHIGTLALLKYSPFFARNINSLFQVLGLSWSMEVPAFVLPIGISFYTMQAVSYVLDVYRRQIDADRNLPRLALYMSFFPQIMEGPICRYGQTAHKLWEAPALHHDHLILGLQRIGYGVIKKVIIADRLNLFIKNVFDKYENYDGFVIAVAAVCYTIQLYMDFSGTMDMAVGTGRIFGVSMPENFKRPFCSRTIPEFWQRWHISLGTWFKDYLFYPISMSGPMKRLTSRARKRAGNHLGPLAVGSIALFTVWLCNGLWHGAAWNYIFFGMYHFSLILAGNLAEPFAAKWTACLGIDRSERWYRRTQIVRSTVLVCIGELFFRANGFLAGVSMFRRIFTEFSFSTLTDQRIFTFGMDKHDWAIVAIVLVIIAIISDLQERGIQVGEALMGKPIILRFAVWYAMILAVVLFGAYGEGYVPVDPIYAGF